MQQDDLHNLIEAARREHGYARIVRLSWRGDTVFLKQAGAAKTWQWWHYLHAALSKILPPILRHGALHDEKTALKLEAERLRLWQSKNLPAPRLLAEGDGWIVLSNGGLGFWDVLVAASPEARQELLPDALNLLLSVHRAGEAHGRPMVKDMTRDENGGMALLDHEEDASKIMPLTTAQARDILIFLTSTVKFATRDTLAYMARQALLQSDPQVRKEIFKALHRLKFIRKILGCVPEKSRGREINNGVVLYDLLWQENISHKH